MSSLCDEYAERPCIPALFRMSNKGKYPDEEEIAYASKIHDSEKDVEQLKSVVKITHKWLEKLSPEEMNAFKRSEDFEKYKEALKSLGMIR